MLTKTRRQQVTKAITYFVLVALCFWQIPFAPHTAQAATLSASRDHLSRNKASQTTLVDHIVTFTTSSVDGTENKLKLVFPDADDSLWCRTAGTDLVVTTSTEDGAAGLPGSLTGACTQGSGASSFDTITISGTSNLSTSTRYGVKISDGSTGKLGTPTAGNDKVITLSTMTSGSVVIDSQNIAESIVADDQIAVTATVDATMSFSLDTNAVAFGTLSQTQVNKGAIVATVSTSGTNGYSAYVKYNNKLRIDVSNDIDDTSGGTIVAGTEEFGVATSDSGVAIGTWSPTSCTSGASTSNATAVTTSDQIFADASVPVTGEATTLCFLTSISATTTAGTYSSTATLTAAAKF